MGIASEKGRSQRPYKKDNRNKYWQHYVAKHGGFIVQIVREGISLEDACYWERWYIKLLGKKIEGGQLVNLADGGETNAGCKKNTEQKKQLSDRAKLRGTKFLLAPEIRRKAGATLSKLFKGRFKGDENPNFGNKWTPEMKRKLSEKKKEHFKNIPSRRKVYQKLDPVVARRNIYIAMVNSWGKKVVCTKTGIIFNTIVDAASSIGMKKDTLRQKLNGGSPNETYLVFLSDTSRAI